MKTIGLLGGMSWESTLGYYRSINQGIKNALGGLHSAEIVLYSVDFDPVEKMLSLGDWDGVAESLSLAAESVEAAGADFLLLCTNTMHMIADQIQDSLGIPLLHIADATAESLVDQEIERVGLLGTALTMEQDFYRQRLQDMYGIETLIPDMEERRFVHEVIFQELCLGTVNTASKRQYLQIIQRLAEKGARGVILGCTEIGMLVKQQDTRVRLFDTTAIHAEKAVDYALT
ncbi:MAG: aspartate/glutamate racemase family protein [Desulfovermiculus sp.]|nr:aspartate/glutamate racemase family protein [Desulfovermiculus sp.]